MQYLLGCYKATHPNHHRVNGILWYKCEPLDQQAYQAGLSGIHSDAAKEVKEKHIVNIVSHHI